jgi:enolase
VIELTTAAVAQHTARALGWTASVDAIRTIELAGGVSNAVWRVEPPNGEHVVVKQSRARLRTRLEWFSRLDRIWRETAFLEACTELLPPNFTPRVLHADRDNYVFIMTAAPSDHHVWKTDLLAGRIDISIGRSLGEVLGRLHAGSSARPELKAAFEDLAVFDELRIDPFYRTVATRRPESADAMRSLIEEMAAHRSSLVHADFSPKNVLVHGDGLTLVDFETGHWGDPAFDVGFFFSHLMLKRIALGSTRGDEMSRLLSETWTAYAAVMSPVFGGPGPAWTEYVRRCVRHLAGCLWSRIDGKSPVDYLVRLGDLDAVRRLAAGLFATSATLESDSLFTTILSLWDQTAADAFRVRNTATAPGTSRMSRSSTSRSSTAIQSISALQVLDSRGKPTVEVTVALADGVTGTAIVPSGASTGRFEAHELRDGDSSAYNGQGVLQACRNVETEIAAALDGVDAADQTSIDDSLCQLDGTPDKSRLGANAILGVSMAVCVAAANAKGVLVAEHIAEVFSRMRRPLSSSANDHRTLHLGRGLSIPIPMVNMISGGLHAGRNLDFQDFLIIPLGAPTYSLALEWVVRVYRRLGAVLQQRGFEGVLVGDEGGYGPKLSHADEALDALAAAVTSSGLKWGDDVAVALDVASTHFFENHSYQLTGEPSPRSAAGMIELLADLVEKHPIVSIEDGLAENDWTGWIDLTRALGDRVQLVGDDLFVTNSARLEQGIASHAANSVLIKVNQIGSLTETFRCLDRAIAAGYVPVVSARSGETEDSFLADLAVGTGAGQIKIGGVARSERLAKYNRLLRLERQLGSRAPFAGRTPFAWRNRVQS